MVVSAGDAERAERALKRSVFKRDNAVKQFQAIVTLGTSYEKERAHSNKLLLTARLHDMNQLLSEFHKEQDSIMDQLILLDRESEFNSVHAPIENKTMEQFYLLKALSLELNLESSNDSDKSQHSSTISSHIQLPKIKLPAFDGELSNWCSFRDTFTSLVHDNVQLSNTEKFHYLISAVSGTAASVVCAIPLTDNNYIVAWDALHDAFDNKRLLITNHLDNIFRFTPLTTESLCGLRSFLSTFQENIAAINALEIDDLAGFLLFYVASRVLPSNTKRLFEAEHHANDSPNVTLLLKFIQIRCQILQNTTPNLPIKQHAMASRRSINTKSSFFTSSNTDSHTAFKRNSSDFASFSKPCPLCQAPHYIYKCEKFQQLSAGKRLKLIQARRMCTNCLSDAHVSSKCSSKYNCRICSLRHHSLLHLDTKENKSTSASIPTPELPSTSSTDTTSPTFVGTASSTNLNVLGTARIRIRDKSGNWIPVRALIDSGSQISAITHSCATQLGLTRRRSNVAVVGLSQSPIARTKGITICSIIPHALRVPELKCEPFILLNITGTMPSTSLDPAIRLIHKHLNFADPLFDQPGRIDFLLGADLYNQIFLNGYQVRHTNGLPSAFETTLGWIFMGTASHAVSSTQQISLTMSTEPSLKQLLDRFWDIEEPVVHSEPFTEEQKCEKMFCQSTTRDDTGRYVVTFPFKTSPEALGESRTMATSRFLKLEQRLQKDPTVYVEYRKFMEEYISLGHMKIATDPGKYIIPHHAVVKYLNDKIKLRVVFDASAHTSTGKSLNEILFTGPKLQCDIMDLLLRCRLHKYMFTADIAKMYRQINIASTEQEYQHILWRNDPTETVQEYALTTVTYGVASAPFQAIRVLHQLETDEGYQYPAANGVLSTRTYVDDIITGEETIDKILTLQEQVIKLLCHGKFELKKWASNCPEVLRNVPVEDRVTELSFDPKDDSSIKILGLHWEPCTDKFSYHSDPCSSTQTKRAVLSTIAKMYDPLGVLAPITFWAKCFMQILWKNGYDWDQPISEELSTSWKLFSTELPYVSSIKLTRYIPTSQCSDAQLIGFSDASIKGYSAVVYLRLTYASGAITIHLLTAKSKVAPLKLKQLEESLSVPRLELCGALLLTQTLHRVQNTLSSLVCISATHAWTDSTVVLSWLTAPQVQFKVFITNRLNKILELLPNCQWHHVSSMENPADCVSRGMYPVELVSHSLYWNGPNFLRQPASCWSATRLNFIPWDQLPERKLNRESVLHATACIESKEEWLKRFSSFTRLQRTIVYMGRFIARARALPAYSGFIRYEELKDALTTLVKVTQSNELQFQTLVTRLSSTADTVISPSLARLMPFIDADKIIRVGGRLRNSNSTEDFKHPILLPKECVLTTLLILHYHVTNFHAGPQLVASLLSAKFWILSSRSVIRHIIHKCVICARHRATNPAPIMGDLPSSRICPSRPFSNVGIDYAGPLAIKEGKRRNARATKCYIAIFICMAVKAVHIEVVSDLSTPTFIAALQRFISRRGIPVNIFSDCGTNFQGADVVLRALLRDPVAQGHFADAIPCRWHFNPPAAPHFGGLWEAAVKSAKYHIKRVIGKQLLTFEEMSTFTHRVEAVLNSRPLTPQSVDPNDLRALTPGDFLIGCPLVALPEPDMTSTPMNRLSRWQLLNQFNQSFWKRWSSEYLTTLQGRSKWYRKQRNLEVGDLVLVNRPNVPPTHWKLGRIESTHPGDDGIVRVVTVRTQDGVYKRPVAKLALLPMDES